MIPNNFTKIDSKISKIIEKSINKTINQKLSSSESQKFNELLNNLNSLSEQDIFSKYPLLTSLISSVLPESIDDTLLEIKNNIEDELGNKFSNMDLEEMLTFLFEKECFDFIHNLPSGEHVVLLWSDKNFRDRFMLSYFHPDFYKNVPRLFFSQVECKIPGVNTKLFPEFTKIDKEHVLQETIDVITNSMSENKSNFPGLVACEDDTWWFKAGLDDSIMSFEKVSGPKTKNNFNVICSYNYLELPKETIETLTLSHSYVILDNPISIYEQKI